MVLLCMYHFKSDHSTKNENCHNSLLKNMCLFVLNVHLQCTSYIIKVYFKNCTYTYKIKGNLSVLFYLKKNKNNLKYIFTMLFVLLLKLKMHHQKIVITNIFKCTCTH